MITWTDIPLRIVIIVQLFAMGMVRVYFGAPGRKEPAEASPQDVREPAWLTSTLGMIAALHFGAIFAYLMNPSLLRWSAFEASEIIRWIGITLSCVGMAGEIWSAAALGASYSPMLRVADEHVVVTAGPYRWIRHPLYAFWLPVGVGWGAATCNWFIIVSGIALIIVLAVIRVPREEAMMLQGFGESYRRYMTHTGRFIPRLRIEEAN
jgi:protein-S-isoprenylcysteine O-methyltransferase Ste14